jgi:hypothetical protein
MTNRSRQLTDGDEVATRLSSKIGYPNDLNGIDPSLIIWLQWSQASITRVDDHDVDHAPVPGP